MSDYASIITFEEFDHLDRNSLGVIVCTSGGFDPIHPGHTSCIIESKKFGDTLVVVVNGDNFLRAKKGKPFQSLEVRCQIISCIRQVDYVIPFESAPDDITVCNALKFIKPNVFTKGGDRIDIASIPEWKVCEELGIKIIVDVGFAKKWSSSQFLDDWKKM